jgi:hypothetical protein
MTHLHEELALEPEFERISVRLTAAIDREPPHISLVSLAIVIAALIKVSTPRGYWMNALGEIEEILREQLAQVEDMN